MYCEHCGVKISDDCTYCTSCGAPVRQTNNSYNGTSSVNKSGKSKLIVVVLAILLGGLGIHNFYLGYKGKGIAQLLLTLVGWIFLFGPFIAYVWSFIEGIIYLVSSDKTDADGNLLV